MLLACVIEEISDPFLFVNDDHFFTRDFEAATWPYFHKGQLRGTSLNRDYSRRLENTRKGLLARGLPTLNYDVHAPVLIHKEVFRRAFATWDHVDLEGPGVVMKSVYCNSVPAIAEAGQYLAECKLSRRTPGMVQGWLDTLAERPCFSVAELISPVAWLILERLFPNPSPYEA